MINVNIYTQRFVQAPIRSILGLIYTHRGIIETIGVTSNSKSYYLCTTNVSLAVYLC